MLRVKEAAERLGVHPGTVYRWIWSGEMQHVRYGKVRTSRCKGRGGAIRIPEREVADREARAKNLEAAPTQPAA